MNLESVQRSFWAAMREPPIAAESLASCFLGDARLTALERVSIYRRAYWIRQLEVLEDEFRRVAHRIGREAFRELATKYVHQHPSTEPRIECLGRFFPEFLGSHPDPETCRLAPLASFEWAEVEALMAPDSREVTRAFSVSPELFPTCTIELVPSLRLLDLAADPLAGSPTAAEPSTFAVWRHGFVVNHRRLERDEHEAVRAVQAGASVAEICAGFGDTPTAATRVSEVFALWLGDGWIARFVSPPQGGTP